MPDPIDHLRWRGVHLLIGRIEEDTVRDAIAWIMAAPMERERLRLVIHSEGGEMTCAFALVDAMWSSPLPVDTLGLGYVASSGLIVFMAGDRRVLTSNTAVCSHQWSGSTLHWT